MYLTRCHSLSGFLHILVVLSLHLFLRFFFIRRSAIYNAGSVPLLAKLIKLDKQDFLIPFVGLAQECAVEVSF